MHIWIMLFLISCLCACAQKVRISHSPLENVSDLQAPIGINVLVQVLPDELQTTHEQSGLLVVGVLSDWEIDLNKSLPMAAQDVLQQHYVSVKTVKHFDNTCDDCGMIVRPRITNLKLNKLTMQAVVDVEFSIYDANSNLICVLNSTGSSAIVSATRLGTGVVGYFVPFFGNAVGSYVVGGTVRSALDNALVDVSEQLASETRRGGRLARMFLPKNTKSVDGYAEHEFVAERLARREGCDLATDGVQLLEKKYSKETFEAHCWGRPVFIIACEYGSCDVEASDESLASRPDDSETRSN